jgi:glycolate oxidase FAD binding subunit
LRSASSVRPATVAELAAALREQTTKRQSVRPRGGGTKLGWGVPADDGAVEIETTALSRIVEHNTGDFTAVVEAGARLAEVEAAFAEQGQMLALDPPLGASDGATIGGIVATADSGPLRHRYGAPRDLVLGMTFVLSDGTVASSGGKVIKNVAGYDIGKLMTGSFGTLAVIASVAVRLHPLSTQHCTSVATIDEPERLAAAALALAAEPLEATCFDIGWEDGAGRVLLRFDGVAAAERARSAAAQLEAHGLGNAQAVTDDARLWQRQRSLQRRADGTVVKVATRLTGLAAALRAAREFDGSLVARAGLGVAWIGLAEGADVTGLRAVLAPAPTTVLDGADRAANPWPPLTPAANRLMRSVKTRFDPTGTLRPGVFAGGI